ncbi:MAG: nitrilase-related carbon-nitrogen hydrolase, partial [Acidobacteriaceae bacterium]
QSIFIPTAIGWHPSEKSEFGAAQYSAWKAIQRAHAIANGVFVCAVNRVGHEHGDVLLSNPDGTATEVPGPGEHTPGGGCKSGIDFWGGSFIADPFGRILAQASHNQEEIVTATLDPALVETTRQHWPFLRDRRIDAYANITSRMLD